MQRPTGITILGLLAFVSAGFLVLLAVTMFLGGAMISTLAARPQIRMLAGVGGAFLGIALLMLAILYAVMGFGLWKLQNWARILTIVLCAIALVFGGFGLLFSLSHLFGLFFFGIFLRRLIVIAIQAWILVYLFKPHVKQAFGATSF